MRKTHWIALAALIGVLGATAYSQLPAPVPVLLSTDMARISKLDEPDVTKMLDSLGPAITRQLAIGRQVKIPGLGIFRVVRLSQTRNLEDGRVVTQPARNVVEFLPDAVIEQAANAPGAVPAVTVPAFQYQILPGQTPGQKVPNERVPSTRVR